MKFICKSCGAEIDDSMPKCPYCDTMIPRGAEAEYMEKLYDIQEDLEDLKDIPIDVVKDEVKHQGRRMKKIAMITTIVVIVFSGIFFWQEKKYERNNTEDYIWGQKNFPIMSEMYENREYEKLEAFYLDACEEDRPVWNWEYSEEFEKWMEEQ